MKTLFALLATTLFLGSSAAFAKSAGPDYTGPKDMTAGCGNAVIEKMAADSEVSQYLTDEMTVSLDWSDDEKKSVSFTFNFGEDVRDGYMTGEVAVKVTKTGYCVVGKVLNTSVGD